VEEITAEFDVATLAPTADLHTRLQVVYGAKTDMGRVRDNNEDKYEFYLPDSDGELATRGLIFIVCDGMGGHEAGQFASELSVKTFIDVYRSHPSVDPVEAARAAVLAANRFVLDVSRAIPARRGMGTTLSALMLVQDKAIVSHVGDSRIYRLRDGQIEQITEDHTWVEETVKAGIMSREDAEMSQYRHAITRAIGSEDALNPDVFAIDLKVGDYFFICSDGVTNHVNPPEIESTLKENGPSAAVWTLVNLALAGGGSDNATGIAVRVEAMSPALAPGTQS
jgi:protein phosphatase